MKGDLFEFANGHLIMGAGISYRVIHMDVAQHTALTIRVSERYLHNAPNNAIKGPRKGHTKHVQVWHRLAACDPFTLRMELPFSLISNAFTEIK